MEDKLIQLIGNDRMKIISAVNLMCPTARLCGSISLIYYGVIDRAIGDIDFVIPLKDTKIFKGIITEDSEAESEAINTINEGDESTGDSFRCKIGEFQFCLFVQDDSNSIEVDLNGLKIKIDHPKFAIEAKRKYVAAAIRKKNEATPYYKKHVADIEAYEKWMGSFI